MQSWKPSLNFTEAYSLPGFYELLYVHTNESPPRVPHQGEGKVAKKIFSISNSYPVPSF